MANTTKKKKLVIEWPQTPFSIKGDNDGIMASYPGAKEITIRFRINKAIQEGELAYIGKNPTAVGRPTIMFARLPITSENLQIAVDRGVILDEQFEDQLIDVAKVDGLANTATTKTTQNAVAQTV
jgi:hypothetical protein